MRNIKNSLENALVSFSIIFHFNYNFPFRFVDVQQNLEQNNKLFGYLCISLSSGFAEVQALHGRRCRK